MTFYALIWWLSLGLAGLSLVVMAGLVVRRVITDRMAARHERRKLEMLEWLLDSLVALVPEETGAFVESERDAKILVEVIEHLLRSLQGEERERLIAVLRSLGGLKIELERLRHGKEWQREAAAGSLRFLEGPGIRGGLRRALDDPSPKVRCAAARALVHLGAVGSARLLIDKLIVEAAVPPQAVRDVFRGLGPLFHDELIPALWSDHQAVQIVAIDTLGHSGDLRMVAPLIVLLAWALAVPNSKELAANLYRALALLGDPRALPAVKKGFRSPAWEVRCQAALCAGQIRAHEAESLLTGLLDDPVWWVRYRAAEALFELGAGGIAVLRQLSREATGAGQTAQLVLAEKAIAP